MSESERDRLQREVGDLIDELWQVPRFAGLRRRFAPQADCFRTDEPPTVTVVVELPGVDPAEVRVEALPGVLTISGERCRAPIHGRVYQLELEHGPFERRIALPDDVDVAAARASYEHGLLTIVLPLAERRATRPFTVPIRGDSG